MEIWKDVPGYEGKYKVSNQGRVRSLNGKEKLLKPYKTPTGYLSVALSKNGIAITIKIHQLVAMAFLGHVRNGLVIVVDHIDANRTNNNLTNLQLITNRENASKDKKGYSSKYVGVCWNKLTEKWDSNIHIERLIKIGTYDSELDASNAYKKALYDWENKGIKPKRKPQSSKYKGVYWCKSKKKWIAYVHHKSKRYHVGAFDDEKEAHLAVIKTKDEFLNIGSNTKPHKEATNANKKRYGIRSSNRNWNN